MPRNQQQVHEIRRDDFIKHVHDLIFIANSFDQRHQSLAKLTDELNIIAEKLEHNEIGNDFLEELNNLDDSLESVKGRIGDNYTAFQSVFEEIRIYYEDISEKDKISNLWESIKPLLKKYDSSALKELNPAEHRGDYSAYLESVKIRIRKIQGFPREEYESLFGKPIKPNIPNHNVGLLHQGIANNVQELAPLSVLQVQPPPVDNQVQSHNLNPNPNQEKQPQPQPQQQQQPLKPHSPSLIPPKDAFEEEEQDVLEQPPIVPEEDDEPPIELENPKPDVADEALLGGKQLLVKQNAKDDSPSPSKNVDLNDILDQANFDKYKEIFDEDDYLPELSDIIKTRYAEKSSLRSLGGIRQSSDFRDRLGDVLPAVQLAMLGARRELEAAKQGGNKDHIKKFKDKSKALDEIYGMLHSLEALSNNKYRYTKAQWDDKKKKLGAAIGNPNHDILTVLDTIMLDQIYSEKSRLFHTNYGGATPFESLGKEFSVDDKYSKELKISHKKISATETAVTGIFSYDPKALFSNMSFVKQTVDQMREQVKDFVAVAMHEHNKGSDKDPINIEFPDKENPAPEIAILILMEFKRQAVLQGKSLYAMDNGARIEITAKPELNATEMNYFMKYAMEKARYKDYYDIRAPVGCVLFNVRSTQDDKAIKEGIEDGLLKQLGMKGPKSPKAEGSKISAEKDNNLILVANELKQSSVKFRRP